jgi:sarcosine oxidase subunit beta
MPEVIIIGAGVIGCSIAYHLAKMGCPDVTVLEKNFIGSGSTERCAGGIRQQFSTEANIRLSAESVRFFEHFEEETGHPADFRQNGYLMLVSSP